MRRPRDSSDAPSEVVSPSRSTRKCAASVLVVSSDDAVCEPLVAHLCSRGFRVTHRRRTVHVRLLIRQADVAVLVTTLSAQQDSGGWRILAQLQSGPPADIPIIVLADPCVDQLIEYQDLVDRYTLRVVPRNTSVKRIATVIADVSSCADPIVDQTHRAYEATALDSHSPRS
jgi:CheY-like chemotaxis protein